MRRGMKGVLGVALALTCSNASAYTVRNFQELSELAGIFVAFDLHKDKCNFERIIHDKFAEIDAHLGDMYPPHWRRAKAEQKYAVLAATNMGMAGAFASRNPNVPPECGYTILMMSALTFTPYAQSDPAFMQALQKLGSASGNKAVQGLSSDMQRTLDDAKRATREQPTTCYIGDDSPACVAQRGKR